MQIPVDEPIQYNPLFTRQSDTPLGKPPVPPPMNTQIGTPISAPSNNNLDYQNPANYSEGGQTLPSGDGRLSPYHGKISLNRMVTPNTSGGNWALARQPFDEREWIPEDPNRPWNRNKRNNDGGTGGTGNGNTGGNGGDTRGGTGDTGSTGNTGNTGDTGGTGNNGGILTQIPRKGGCGCGGGGGSNETQPMQAYHTKDCCCCCCKKNRITPSNYDHTLDFKADRAIIPVRRKTLLSSIVPNSGQSIYGASQNSISPLFVPNGVIGYKGGPLITRPEVILIFSGFDWNNNLVDTALRINDFFDYILQSRYMTIFNEYSVGSRQFGRGQRIQSFFNPFVPGFSDNGDGTCTIRDSDIVDYLNEFINFGPLPSPQADGNGIVQQLFFVYTPLTIFSEFSKTNLQVQVELNPSLISCQEICGYHNSSQGNLFYSVIPFPQFCPECMKDQSRIGIPTVFNALTIESSAQLCGAMSDPTLHQSWFDRNQGEITIPCSHSFDTVGRFAVQKIWSNQQNACVTKGSISKLILSDTAFGAPALATDNAKQILGLAWTGTNPGHNLNIMTSNVLGVNGLPSFNPKMILGDSSSDAPAIAFAAGQNFGGTKLFMAWKANDSGNNIFISSSAISSSGTVKGFTPSERLPQTTIAAPALAFAFGKLFIAWVGTNWRNNINIMSTSDGITFSNVITLNEWSGVAPALSVLNPGLSNEKLVVLWRGYDDARNLYMLESTDNDNGNSFNGHRVDLTTESSHYAPSLLQVSSELILAWNSNDPGNNLFLKSSNSDIRDFHIDSTRYEDQSEYSFPMVSSMGKSFIGWTGINPGQNINIADLSDFVPL